VDARARNDEPENQGARKYERKIKERKKSVKNQGAQKLKCKSTKFKAQKGV
jgi:hypothetical protein